MYYFARTPKHFHPLASRNEEDAIREARVLDQDVKLFAVQNDTLAGFTERVTLESLGDALVPIEMPDEPLIEEPVDADALDLSEEDALDPPDEDVLDDPE